MDILKKNTTPSFDIVPREALDVLLDYKFIIVNEMTNATEDVLASIISIPNENYTVTLTSFPVGKIGEKLSYKLVYDLTNEVVSLGKLIIVSEFQDIQDYTRETSTKFYT